MAGGRADEATERPGGNSGSTPSSEIWTPLSGTAKRRGAGDGDLANDGTNGHTPAGEGVGFARHRRACSPRPPTAATPAPARG
jgi:hypothetical protein